MKEVIMKVPSFSADYPKAPIYVAELVRCAECKYWRNTDAEQIPTANIMCGHMHPDDFCSYGERNCSEKPTGSEKPNNSGAGGVGKYPYNCNWDE